MQEQVLVIVMIGKMKKLNNSTFIKRREVSILIQFYKDIRLELINRNYKGRAAKRYTLGGTNQNVWIPNKHLEPNGAIKQNENIDYVFRKAQRQLELAGYTEPIIGIKRRSVVTTGGGKRNG